MAVPRQETQTDNADQFLFVSSHLSVITPPSPKSLSAPPQKIQTGLKKKGQKKKDEELWFSEETQGGHRSHRLQLRRFFL